MSEWDSAPLAGVIFDVPSTMDEAVRDLWVAVLRSGVYTQGYDRLRSLEDHFTPLGVLCDLAVRVGVTSWDKLDGEWVLPSMHLPMTGGLIPPAVIEWAGFKGMNPSQLVPLKLDGVVHTLVALDSGVRHPIWRLSDIFCMSFTDIADIIEAQY